MNKTIKNLFYIFFPLLIGGLVSIFIAGKIDYQNLIQPPLAPPKILFPFAWTILYLLIGLAYYKYKKDGFDDDFDKLVYYVQLFVNALWSIFFFVLKWRLFSCFWIIILDILVILLIKLFNNKSKVASYLLIPYLLWILFATYLTIGIYILN